MDSRQIIEAVRALDGALVVEPDPASGLPELAWGDAFFYYAPDGVMPERTQPYGTIITKDYPGDTRSTLDLPGRFRVNIHVGRAAMQEITDGDDPSAPDSVVPHPLYADAGWVSVVNPGPRTSDRVLSLLSAAHRAARARVLRRQGRR
ncbi:DUF6194 family protein [Leifsonia sp. NPDC058292]|uniref:DUF6194 family protein n=1 Tax=Leifsonia sp. NPDC058292 TaxID=3346428 RepID=UPI0036DF5A22